MSIVLRCLVLLLGITLAGCVTSKAPLLSRDSRVLPFLPSTAFEVYEREKPSDPWKKNEKRAIFAADASLVVRELDDANKPKDEATYTFHPMGSQRFLVQAQFKRDEPYAYGVLEVRDGEGLVTGLGCKVIDRLAFRRAGGSVKDDFCDLGSARDPLALLHKLAAKPAGVQVRYVPVAK